MNPSTPGHLSDYHYDLPKELIAQEPSHERGQSRLLVLHRDHQSIEHRKFGDIEEYLRPGDCLVANDSKVMRARLIGNRIPQDSSTPSKMELGGRVEFFLLESIEQNLWKGLMKASAKVNEGFKFVVPDERAPDGWLRAQIVGVESTPNSGRLLVARFDLDPLHCSSAQVPLPPYIARETNCEQDQQRYQTVYANQLGSSAAPTAGLHFDQEHIESLKNQGIDWQTITLHVGLGTFLPVKTSKIEDHQMHFERYQISASTVKAIELAKSKRARTIAVGTTSMRTLEGAYLKNQELSACEGQTDLYIYPGSGHHFAVVDGLLTNFHLPQSTLLMLVQAFAGRDLIVEAYSQAITNRYRFFSYGDAMLIL